MKITKTDIEKLLKEMEELGVDEVNMDIETEFMDSVWEVDFDAWVEDHFIKTLLTVR